MKGKMKKILGLAISAAMAVSAVMPWTGVTAFAEGETITDTGVVEMADLEPATDTATMETDGTTLPTEEPATEIENDTETLSWWDDFWDWIFGSKDEVDTQDVYVYVENSHSSQNAVVNDHGYYTVGKITLTLPDASEKYSKDQGKGDEVYNNYADAITEALKSISRYEANSWLGLEDVNWYSLHTDSGADDYVSTGWTWHLDGAIKEDVQKYTVTFDANGGSFRDDSTTVSVEGYLPGENINTSSVADPEKTDWNFLGWSFDPLATEPGHSFVMPESDVTLYAVWELAGEPAPDTFTVEYSWTTVPADKELPSDLELPQGGTYQIGESFDVDLTYYTGYTVDAEDGTWTFSGWSVSDENGVVAIEGTWTFEADEEPPVVEPGDDNVTIDKTATDLVDDTTDVTLSIGATEGKDKVAVMFVLDYSTSVDVRDAAADMLDELKTKENTDVKVCVINYWADADKGEWITLTSETDTNDLLKATQTGGTNIHGGLLTAEEALESSEIEDYETYLITISDGLTYLWSDDEGETQSVWFQTGANGEDSIQNGNSVIEMKYPAGKGQSSKIPDEIFNALVTGNQSIIEKYDNTVPYFTPYSEPFSDGGTPYISFQPDWVADDGKTAEDFLIGTEIAIYKSADVFNRLVGSVDHVITLKKDENHWGQYPYGEQLMDWMISQSGDGSGYVTDETAAEVFSGIRDLILYEIQTGTVTDVIGDDFDFAGLDTVRLTVGTDVLTGTISGNTISFDDGNYVVTYYPNGTENDSREQFKWEINVPVEAEKGVALTYTLNLVNKSTTPGSHTVPTNEEAVLDYTSTTGAENQKEFPEPEVTYTVADTSEPSDPGPDNPPYIPDGGDEEEPSEPTEEIPEEETPQTSLPTDDTSVPDAIPGEPSAPSTEEIPDNTTPQTAQPPQTGARAAGSVVLLAGAAVVAALTLRRKK